jgi:phototropin
MSRTSKAKDASHSRGSEPDFRRMSSPMMPTNFNYMDAAPSSRILSPPPTPRSPPPRPDRLSLRLRSNSGLKMHTNDAALSQYTDYQSSGQYSPRKLTFTNSIAEHAHQNIDHVLSPRATRPTSRQSMTLPSPGWNSALPFLDLLGKDAFQMAMDNPSIIRHMIRYSEEQGSSESVEFLLKVSGCENDT